jgi:hypothetical protein
MFGFFRFSVFVSSVKVQPELLNQYSWLIAPTTCSRLKYTFLWVS